MGRRCLQALNDARRLVKHHRALAMRHLAELVQAAAPSLDALRSTTAKTAMTLIQVCQLSASKCNVALIDQVMYHTATLSKGLLRLWLGSVLGLDTLQAPINSIIHSIAMAPGTCIGCGCGAHPERHGRPA